MKTTKINLKAICTLLLIVSVSVFNQNAYSQNLRPKVGVLSIDGKIPNGDPGLFGNMARIELSKLDTFEVLDKYDVQDALKKNGLPPENCFGKECLVSTGNVIGADFMLTGSVEIIANNIIVSLKLIDVKKQIVVRTAVKTFSNLPGEISNMISITMNSMFGRKYDETLNDRLTKKFDYENPVNQPNVSQLNLQGPRMGITYLFGQDGKILSANKNVGGFGLNPLMFQIGYQFEKQYLTGGNYQALFEFMPMITGIDQSTFLPSIAIVHGLRNNKNGWELGVGFVVAFTNIANTYKGSDGTYYLMDDNIGNQRSYLNSPEYKANPNLAKPTNTEERFDSGGDSRLMTSFIIAIGKSFRTGNLNVPVNFWAMPQKDAIRLGISVGFNSVK